MTLTNVLPGLRQLRAPLAAGYLWLLFVYLVADLGEADPESGIVKEIADLGGALSPVGIAVAVSFVAYLVGSLSTWLARLLGRGLYELVNPRSPSRSALTSRGFATLEDLIAPRVASGQVEGLAGAAQLSRAIMDELDLIKTRLIGTEPELYAEIDRLHAEADFRFAMVLPLIAVGTVGVLAIPLGPGGGYWHVLMVTGVVILVEVLTIHGLSIWTEANDKLLDALYLERVDSPALERLDRETPAA